MKMTLLLKKFNEFTSFLDDISDKRVKNWIFMDNPYAMLSINVLYLVCVYKIFPAFMKNRKAYELKTFVKYYDIFQIVANSLLVYGVSTSGWTTHYSFGCQLPDYSNDPLALRMLSMVYFCFLLKGVDLIETVVFILRKKYNQVSNLHVYHHVSTFILCWLGAKYIGGGMATFPILINSSIHVLMYTYYFLASLGPEWQKRIRKLKPKLTMFQMIQFFILIVHSLIALLPSCAAPKIFLLLYVPNVALVWKMFWNFYKKNYLSRNKKTK